MNIIKDFHDNNLSDFEDQRLFRLIIDSDYLLDNKFLHNLKNYSRKTNISILLISKDKNIIDYIMYFDKVY